MTQADLSAVSGIDQPNISAIENGRRMPTAETLQRLLAACGYELLAAAGNRVVAIPPPGDDMFEADDVSDEAPFGPSSHGPGLDAEVRARMMVGVLDAAEAIVRGRQR